jgi:hypothetical protein
MTAVVGAGLVAAVLLLAGGRDAPSSEAPPLEPRPAPDRAPEPEPVDAAPPVQVSPVVLPDEELPDAPPKLVSHRHLAHRMELERRAARAYPGPYHEQRAAQKAGEHQRANELWGTRSERVGEIRGRPQMRALAALRKSLTEVKLLCAYEGLTGCAEVLAERELYIEDLGSDGEVPVAEVQAHGCALTETADRCPTRRSCSSFARLDEVAERVCADPLAPIPEELHDNSDGFLEK